MSTNTTVDLPERSTIGGFEIATIDSVNGNLSLYLGIIIASFIIVLFFIVVYFRWELSKLKKYLYELKHKHKKVEFYTN